MLIKNIYSQPLTKPTPPAQHANTRRYRIKKRCQNCTFEGVRLDLQSAQVLSCPTSYQINSANLLIISYALFSLLYGYKLTINFLYGVNATDFC